MRRFHNISFTVLVEFDFENMININIHKTHVTFLSVIISKLHFLKWKSVYTISSNRGLKRDMMQERSSRIVTPFNPRKHGQKWTLNGIDNDDGKSL